MAMNPSCTFSPLVCTRSATPLTTQPSVISALPWVVAAAASETGTKRSLLSRSSQLGVSDVSQLAQNFYSPVRNAVCSRYTTNDWANFNKASQIRASRQRAEAEQTRADAWRTVWITDQRTKTRQGDASRSLSERVQDIEFWRKELAREAQLSGAEGQNLMQHLRVLEGALASTARPLQISEECLMHREKRIGIDQVHDEVEKQLTKEVATIRKCQDQMRRMIEKAKVQIKLNGEALHELDKDANNKSHACCIDDRLHQLRNHSAGIAYHPGIETVDNSLSVPDSWARFSHENIVRSQRCRSASEKLRCTMDGLLRACANEMWSQYNSVNCAFNARIREITNTRNSLQSQLLRTTGEMLDTERAIGQLKRAIADKEAPMMVAQTRLEERTHRLHVEICCDAPMSELQREVTEIRDSVRCLKERLRSAEAALSRLSKTHSQLEGDIRVKENSLHIDSKCCMGPRRTFPVVDTKVGAVGLASPQSG